MHALFAGIYTRVLPYLSAWELEIGDCDFERFDRNRGGIKYILKSLGDDEYYIDFDLHKPHLCGRYRWPSLQRAQPARVIGKTHKF